MDAHETLSEVRGWLCDHLSAGDAGNAGPEVMRLAKKYAERLQIKEQS